VNYQKAAEKIVEMLDPKFVKRKGWTEARTETAWGTKTRKGLIASIVTVLESLGFSSKDQDEPLDHLRIKIKRRVNP
jgi:Holliday junction resolvasome RuvABC DNA-binding subunit